MAAQKLHLEHLSAIKAYYKAHEREVIGFTMEVLGCLNLKKRAFGFTSGVIQAQYSMEADGWSACAWMTKKDNEWVTMHGDHGDQLKVTFPSPHDELKTFLPMHQDVWTARRPRLYRAAGFPLVSIMAELFEKIRDKDRDVDAEALQDKFTELARRSGFEQTRDFLKEVEDRLSSQVGHSICVFENRGEVDYDGQTIYKKNYGLLKVSSRARLVFKAATRSALLAVLHAQGKSESKQSDAFHAMLSKPRDTTPRRSVWADVNKRAAEEEEAKREPNNKKARSEGSGAGVTDEDAVLD